MNKLEEFQLLSNGLLMASNSYKGSELTKQKNRAREVAKEFAELVNKVQTIYQFLDENKHLEATFLRFVHSFFPYNEKETVTLVWADFKRLRFSSIYNIDSCIKNVGNITAHSLDYDIITELKPNSTNSVDFSLYARFYENVNKGIIIFIEEFYNNFGKFIKADTVNLINKI